MSISSTTLLEREVRPRVLLVGDVMLDRYVWGDVERISPEAPIPILRIERQEHRLGGAGSVASMLAASAPKRSSPPPWAMIKKAEPLANCSTTWKSIAAW